MTRRSGALIGRVECVRHSRGNPPWQVDGKMPMEQQRRGQPPYAGTKVVRERQRRRYGRRRRVHTVGLQTGATRRTPGPSLWLIELDCMQSMNTTTGMSTPSGAAHQSRSARSRWRPGACFGHQARNVPPPAAVGLSWALTSNAAASTLESRPPRGVRPTSRLLAERPGRDGSMKDTPFVTGGHPNVELDEAASPAEDAVRSAMEKEGCVRGLWGRNPNAKARDDEKGPTERCRPWALGGYRQGCWRTTARPRRCATA